MIAGLPSIAALLLGAATGGGREQRPVHLPFESWAAETRAERQLDQLISEVVTLLEQGDVRFSRWRSRSIRGEFYRLRLGVPHTTEGVYTGRNFLFDGDRFGGIHFRARFAANRLQLFVPSACRERVRPGRRGDEVRPRVEDVPPNESAHVPYDPERRRRLWSSTVFTYEMECGANVRIRFYDAATERRRERLLNGDTGQQAINENYWTGVTIFRAVD